ncbi:MAG TPA: nucleotidyltransferase domain-containing protein [Polyangiaceae bacterium]
MTADATRDLASAIERALRRHGGVELALLFGSHATGRVTESSDIDLALEAPGADLDALGAALSVQLGAEVDLVWLYEATIPLLEALIRDGVVVFEARRGAGAAWRARVLSQLETDRPWYRRMRDAWVKHVADNGIGDGR